MSKRANTLSIEGCCPFWLLLVLSFGNIDKLVTASGTEVAAAAAAAEFAGK